jgi:hypothetical protein
MPKNRFIKNVDKILCRYLGLETTEVNPSSIKLTGQQLFVTTTESYKRHCLQQNWEDFAANNFHLTTTLDKEKLGVAAGKILAKNLLVSFQNISINTKP